MRWTLYGIPASLKRILSRATSGTVGDILWKSFLAVVIVTVALGLMLMGPVGGVIGALLITTLVSSDIRAVVADFWHRRWAEIDSPL